MMKILIADDDALIRRLLTALLTKLGHEVETAEDGEAAWKALENPTPPPMAILDWVMPGLNGVEVCKKLRSHPAKSRTYVLLLSAKTNKVDIIAGLDSGADDYLPKPFDPMALMARLRVAQRIIAYQQDLEQHIAEMETLLKRYNLLGEMFGKHGRMPEAPNAAGAGGAGAKPGAPASTASPAVTSTLLAPERINEMVVRSLAEVGLGNARAFALERDQAGGNSTFTAWAPLILLREGLWVDLLLEADDASAVAMFEALLGRIPVSERELLDFLAETFNLLCTAIKNSLSEQGSTVLAPVISRSIRSAALNVRFPTTAEITRHRFTLPEKTLGLTVVRTLAPVLQKSLGQLHELDILAENLPSPSTKEVFLLNQGVVLNERYIEKLSSLARAENKDLRVPVIKSSRLAEFFCLGRIGGS
jgi:CheY-like chemotaxis protein